MTARERLKEMLRHSGNGGVLVDVGGTDCSAIHVMAYNRLKEQLGLTGRRTQVTDVTQMIAITEPEVHDRLGSDIVALDFMPRAFKPYHLSDGSECEIPALFQYEETADGDQVARSKDGRVVARMPKGGFYFEPLNRALEDVQDVHDLEKHMDVLLHADDPAFLDEPLADMEKRAKELYEATDRGVVLQLRDHVMQAGQIFRGYETYMMDLIDRPALVEAINDTLTEVYVQRGKKLLDRIGKYVDCLFFTEDLGTQNGPIMSPDMYRRLVKPFQARLFGELKKHSGHPVLLHSCGSVYRLIPDLIEIGVDALNPVQVSAVDMDSGRLAREFGRDMVFWGGGCDTQHILHRARPDEVRAEVRRRLADFSATNGYVFCAVHNIQANVPPANIVALYEAAHDFIAGR